MDLLDVTEVVRPQKEHEIPPWQKGDAFVAGGTWLFSEPQPGVRRLIDLTGLGWAPVEDDAYGIDIAATCSYDELEARSQLLGTAAPLFSAAIRTLSSSFKTYGVATVGGNLCLAYGKSMMAPVACALGARYELATPGGAVRELAARDFQVGAMQTIRRPGESLRRVRVPRAATAGSYARRKHSHTPTSHATVMVIAGHIPGSAESAWRLVVSAVTAYPVRIDLPPEPAAAEAAAAAVRAAGGHPLLEDSHGSASYRLDVLSYLAAEAWQAVQEGRP